jgi:predicted ATPase
MSPGPEDVRPPAGAAWQPLESAVKRFVGAWRQGPRPGIDDYLPAGNGLRHAVLIELVHTDLELRLKAGEAARVEEYLARYPELTADRPAVFDLLAAEYRLRRRGEPGLGLDEYERRFPQYRADLPGLFLATRIDGGARDTPRGGAGPPPEVLPEVAGYEVLGLLGRGGMGLVYRARQVSLGRPVALKLLPAECARDPVWLDRFRREARTASALNHPNICTIYDTGESAGRPFLSMELVEGRTLEKLGGGLPAAGLARLAAQAAKALAAAHAAGVVHRDVKPQNLMVRPDGIVKVLDFGLARHLGGPTAGPATDPGTRVGTVLYMSPEQARAEPVGTATDVFSLGIVLYELATGVHPFLADTEAGVLHAVASREPLPPARLNPEVPAGLSALIGRMLARDPRLRPTAAEADAALTELAGEGDGRPAAAPPGPPRRPTVGRSEERAALRAGFEAAAAGRGLILCVTGEPGLGKTTLVEDFLGELATGGRSCSVARGNCSERLAGAEAYLPLLEALHGLLAGPGGDAAARLMKAVAPTWYVQVAPQAARDPDLGRLADPGGAAAPERLKREFRAFWHELSRVRPVVLFLDDLHWADASTTDLLAYVGAHAAGWRLLVVLAYRPSELLLGGHPFRRVQWDLQARGVCREVPLGFLSRADVDGYLALALPGHRLPSGFADLIHARTEGNPLFVVDLLRYLQDRGVLALADGCWTLAGAVPDLQRELPESVRSMIQRKVERLGEAERQLLTAASVQGQEFDAAVVARALGREAAEVEEQLEVLERVHALVRLLRDRELPDGTHTLRCGFVHGLYQNALYASLQPTRRAALSGAVARALADCHGDQSAAVAGELALLFEAAREPLRAADYFRLAAENAARVHAYREAVGLARRGLAALRPLPETPDRARSELRLQLTLGVQLQVTQGYAAPEGERAYARARALCRELGDTAQLFPALWGLWLFHKVRSELPTARELAEQLFALAGQTRDPAQLLQAHQALAVTSLCLGDLAASREHMERGTALYDPERHHAHTFRYGQDPGVSCLAIGAVALWLLGYPEQAVGRSRQAIDLARGLSQPNSLALALHFAAMLHQYRREGSVARERAEAALAIATEQGFSFWSAGGMVLSGWALAAEGPGGRALLQQGLDAWRATGSDTYRTYYLALLAEALHAEGRAAEGLAVLAEAHALVAATGERFHEAELHRLQGELLLASGGGGAEASFREALAVARRQGARSLELRAAASLVRLARQRGDVAAARALLADAYGRFTEGFDTPDLREARALLDGLP